MSALYSGRGSGLHHSGMVLVCAASEAGSIQNSHSRASLLQKHTISPLVVTRGIVLGARNLWYSAARTRANLPFWIVLDQLPDLSSALCQFLEDATKIALGIIMCTPLLPSTNSVMCRSAATLASMYASSRERCFSVTKKSIISRTASVAHALRLSFSPMVMRSEEHTSELQSQSNLVCRLLLEKKKKKKKKKIKMRK